MKKALFFLIFLAAVIWYAEHHYAHIRAAMSGVDAMKEAVEKYKKEAQERQKKGESLESLTLDPTLLSYSKAKILESLARDYKNIGVKTHLAVNFDLEASPEKAKAEYLSVLKTAPEGSLEYFISVFNLGALFGKQQKFKEALKYYQLALDTGIESEMVKKNIEALWMSSSGGGSGGDNKDENEDKNEDQNDQSKNDSDPQNGKEQKKKDLSEQDVKRIMEEIKNQEQNIRAKEQKKSLKGAPNAKDW